MTCCGNNHPCQHAEHKTEIGTEATRKTYGFWSIWSFRFHLTMVLSLGMVANGLMRNTLSMAMVCMVNSTALFLMEAERDNLTVRRTNSSVLIATKTQAGCDDLDLASTDYDGNLVWTSKDQGFLFSAIYWGGVISGLPAGWLSNRYSPKIICLGCFALQMTGCLLNPLVAVRGGIVAMFVLRLIMGIGGQAVLNPCISQIMSRWIPKHNRSTVLALYTAGNQIAMVVGMPLNAWLCTQKQFLGGWPNIFYVNGFFVFVAIVVWAVFVHDNPDESRWISDGERQYINACMTNEGQKAESRKEIAHNTPWRKLCTSMPLWSCILCSISSGVMVTTLVSYVPTYYKQALHLNLKKNGVYSAMPFISQILFKVIFAVIADRMKTKWSPNGVCKIFNSIGTFAVAAFLVATSFTDCTQTTWAIVSLTLANAMFSGQIPGYLTSLLSIAPAYSGLVNGIARFAGQVAAVLSPYMVGLITVHGTAVEWRLVFFIMAGLNIVAGLHFIIFGTVDIQEWAKSPQKSRPGDEMTLLEKKEISATVAATLPDVVKAHEIVTVFPMADRLNRASSESLLKEKF